MCTEKLNTEVFTTDDVNTLSTVAVHAGVAVDNARFLEKIKKQAITDSLTQLYNHLEFQKRLQKEVERCRRYNNKCSLLMFDLDHFKSMNGTYGHQIGEMVLKETAKDIKNLFELLILLSAMAEKNLQ